MKVFETFERNASHSLLDKVSYLYHARLLKQSGPESCEAETPDAQRYSIEIHGHTQGHPVDNLLKYIRACYGE